MGNSILVCSCAENTPADDKENAGFLTAKVENLRFTQFSGEKRCSLLLSVRLPQHAIDIAGGQVETAITDTGKSILSEEPWHRDFFSRSLDPDGQTCLLGVLLLPPPEQVEIIKEVSGQLEYITATTTKKVDSGIIEFRPGVTSEDARFTIGKVKPEDKPQSNRIINLNVNLPEGVFKSAEFYDQDGGRVDTHGQARGT